MTARTLFITVYLVCCVIARASDPRPSPHVTVSIARAGAYLDHGRPEAACSLYRQTLQAALSDLTLSQQSLVDAFLVCFSVARTAENLHRDGHDELAKRLCEDAVAGLRRCQQTMPDWNPKIVAFRLQQTDKLLSQIE